MHWTDMETCVRSVQLLHNLRVERQKLQLMNYKIQIPSVIISTDTSFIWILLHFIQSILPVLIHLKWHFFQFWYFLPIFATILRIFSLFVCTLSTMLSCFLAIPVHLWTIDPRMALIIWSYSLATAVVYNLQDSPSEDIVSSEKSNWI